MSSILIVFGTRPEAIKMAPLIQELKRCETFDVKICVTGQHREMLDQVLKAFCLKPDFDLNIMSPAQTLNEVIAKVLIGLQTVWREFLPELVLVHGDTSTSYAAALAAYHQRIKVGHVEAGLRSNNMYAPFPEEGNRRLTSVLADYHFSPTATSMQNLIDEGIHSEKIYVTGNTVIDALKITQQKLDTDLKNCEKIKKLFSFLDFQKNIILITGHRRENIGVGFEGICEGIRRSALKYKYCQFVYPVHMNPTVKNYVMEKLSDLNNIYLIEPQNYLQFVYLMMNATIVLTDSGGIQEEAPALGKPVLVMRETTERPEAIDAGTARLVGCDPDKIFGGIVELLEDNTVYNQMASSKNPYGEGRSSQIITSIIKSEFLND